MQKINSFKKVLRFSLLPIAIIWDGIYRLHRTFYNYGVFKQETFKVPILSIGNLTFGGTGKTPLTLWIARFFEENNKKVMILSRGYKGNLENKFGILHAGKKLGFNSFEFGDEPILLARGLKHSSVVVGKNRAQNLEYYFPKEQPDVVLLDDGHQHLKLKRDMNIVLFDALMPLSSYSVPPLGYMREGFFGLRDADIVVFNRADLVPEKKLIAIKKLIQPHIHRDITFVDIAHSVHGIFDSNFKKVFEPNQVQGKRVLALAGIGAPEAFFMLLEELGCELIEKRVLPDHHLWQKDELSEISRQASEKNAIVVTTEKDIVKVRHLGQGMNFYYLEIGVKFLNGEADFTKALGQYL